MTGGSTHVVRDGCWYTSVVTGGGTPAVTGGSAHVISDGW